LGGVWFIVDELLWLNEPKMSPVAIRAKTIIVKLMLR